MNFNIIKDKTFHRIILFILFIGAAFSIFYLIGLGLHSSLLLGGLYYILVLTIYMALVMGIGLIYRFAQMANKPLPGIFSLMIKHLTKEQVDNLNKDYNGRKDIVMHEFVLMRLDILLPTTLCFFLILATTLPTIASDVISELVIGEIISIFALSYLMYSGLQAYLFSVKIAGSIPKEEFNIDDIIAATFEATT